MLAWGQPGAVHPAGRGSPGLSKGDSHVTDSDSRPEPTSKIEARDVLFIAASLVAIGLIALMLLGGFTAR